MPWTKVVQGTPPYLILVEQMLITGHEALDADHARIDAFWVEFKLRIVERDRRGAAETCQHGLRFCLDHWLREEGLLLSTGWPQPIIQCHIDDHDRMERGMVEILTKLNGNGWVEQAEVEAFESTLVVHMTSFDLSLVERLRRGTERHQWRKSS